MSLVLWFVTLPFQTLLFGVADFSLEDEKGPDTASIMTEKMVNISYRYGSRKDVSFFSGIASEVTASITR